LAKRRRVHNKCHTSTLIRFWSFVDERGPDDCWEWQGHHIRKGYGQYTVREPLQMLAHRVAWELHHKQEVPEGMCVCHTCDNPPCVNPAHLYLGTHTDNMRDRAERGRSAKGSQNGNAKLTEDQVREIRQLRQAGWKYRQLAVRFGITPTTACQITHRTHWRHIE